MTAMRHDECSVPCATCAPLAADRRLTVEEAAVAWYRTLLDGATSLDPGSLVAVFGPTVARSTLALLDACHDVESAVGAATDSASVEV